MGYFKLIGLELWSAHFCAYLGAGHFEILSLVFFFFLALFASLYFILFYFLNHLWTLLTALADQKLFCHPHPNPVQDKQYGI